MRQSLTHTWQSRACGGESRPPSDAKPSPSRTYSPNDATAAPADRTTRHPGEPGVRLRFFVDLRERSAVAPPPFSVQGREAAGRQPCVARRCRHQGSQAVRQGPARRQGPPARGYQNLPARRSGPARTGPHSARPGSRVLDTEDPAIVISWTPTSSSPSPGHPTRGDDRDRRRTGLWAHRQRPPSPRSRATPDSRLLPTSSRHTAAAGDSRSVTSWAATRPRLAAAAPPLHLPAPCRACPPRQPTARRAAHAPHRRNIKDLDELRARCGPGRRRARLPGTTKGAARCRAARLQRAPRLASRAASAQEFGQPARHHGPARTTKPRPRTTMTAWVEGDEEEEPEAPSPALRSSSS